ncbi:MAG TPA: histidine--tRNA ligase [Nitrososphaeraceae archaeon]|nr:histidine--tRNA ligase [Nitrososphaeraceae archaeon]
MKIELPRGMRDIEFEESKYIELMRQKFIDAAQRFNFNFMEPSPLELLSTLEAKSGPSISNETYSFTDKGGRMIGLRFDLTVGLSRFVSQRRELKMPTKLASFGGVWRYDEPQFGRYRYFHQWDVEIFGSFSNEADSEIIEFVYKFLENLGLEIVVEINHRQIIERFLREKLGISAISTIGEMLRAVDKLSKRKPQQIYEEYEGKLNLSKLRELIEFSNFKGKPEDCPDTNILETFEGWKSTLEIFDSLKSRGVKDVQLNLGVVRGLDYYSGLVFEVFDPSTAIGALVGGGRYDKLTEIFGRKDIGTTGAAGGVERILSAMRNQNLMKLKSKPLIYVVYSSENVKNYAIRIVSDLRTSGYTTDYDFQGRRIDKQINEAISRRASAIIVVDQDEIKNQIVTIRNSKGETSKHKITDLIKKMDEVLMFC